MKVKIAYSQKNNISDIITDVKEQIGTFNSKLIQFYASSTIDSKKISEEMYKAFNNTPCIGATTAGEIFSGKMLDKSIVVMVLGDQIVQDCKIEVLENINQGTKVVDDAFESFEQYFGVSASDLDPKKYVGIALVDGLSNQEEKIYERIGDLTNIYLVGGSAGDDLMYEKTYVYANGKSYNNAAVLTIIRCVNEFDVIKTQSFKEIGKKVKITKADEEKRIVYTINNENATDLYTKILGKENEKPEALFPKYAFGLKIEQNNYLVRSAVKTIDKSIMFGCSLKNNMEYEIIESQNVIEKTKKDLDEVLNKINNASAIICFNCVSRKLDLIQKNQLNDYGNIFKDIPTVGFNCYGECYIGHINHSSVMLIFR